MIDRFWDPASQYTDGVIKVYKNWCLETSYLQHTLGSFIVFSRKKVEKISDLTPDDLIELTDVLKDIEKVLGKTFQPDRFNYLQLGNKLNHLHFHGIPRYKTPRKFAGREWVDNEWGRPPIFIHNETDEEIIIQIKDAIRRYLP